MSLEITEQQQQQLQQEEEEEEQQEEEEEEERVDSVRMVSRSHVMLEGQRARRIRNRRDCPCPIA